MTARLELDHAAAFVTERGNRFSHSSILARSIGTAAVSGVAGAASRIRTGDRLIVETPDTVDAAAHADRPAIIVGLHFGAIELPALYFAHRLGRSVTGPMEEVANPGVQAWFVRSRSRAGSRSTRVTGAPRRRAAARSSQRKRGCAANGCTGTFATSRCRRSS